MIKANEFRTGNLIYEIVDTAENPSFKEIFRISSINEKYSTFHDIDENITSIDSCEPIQLTEEWLLKAGYKKQNGYGYSNYKIYGTILKNDNGFEFHYYGIIIRLDFVHQLQNLFFSFYGEDLVFSTEP